jgi:hypothetical protein
MTNQYLSDKDLQFKTASDAHRALQAQTLSAVRFGNFYQSLLSTDLWNSQASLSRSLGVSKAKISRALMAARLPDEVVEAFDGGEAITYRRAHAIGLLIGALGAGVVRKKAQLLPQLPALTVEQFVLAVVSEPPLERIASTISLVADPETRSVRIQSPHIAQVFAHVRELELFVRASVDLLLQGDRQRDGAPNLPVAVDVYEKLTSSSRPERTGINAAAVGAQRHKA